ncbi:MAG: carbohydrate porin [Pseudomonadota bacterium]
MNFNKTLLAMGLAAAFGTASAHGAIDPEMLLQAYAKLLQRVEQLEAANKRLESSLAESKTEHVKELSARVEDVENEVLELRKPSALEQAVDGISASASLTFVGQRMSGNGDGSDLTSRADVEVELPMGSIGDAEGKLFAHLRAGDGEGVDTGAFAPSNSMAFGHESRMDLMQAWYQLDMPVGGAGGTLGRVEMTVGKIDPFGFFDGNNVADDESEQFLNLAFIHNPLLDAGGDIGVGDDGGSPGLRVAYISDVNGGNNFAISGGVFGAGDDGANFSDTFDGALLIGQAEYAGKTIGSLAGAYRLYGWSNSNALALDETTVERHSGWGVSADQQVASHITLFGRIGHSTKGEVLVDRAYTLGAQFDGGLWGREADRIGLATGWLKASDESGLGRTERPTELYYVWQLNDQVHLSPSLQWIDKPLNAPAEDNVTVWSLRAKASF